jgi:hypothetical protein
MYEGKPGKAAAWYQDENGEPYDDEAQDSYPEHFDGEQLEFLDWGDGRS